MRVATIVIAAIALAALCLAQDVSTGAIRGTVFDPSIRRIGGASVALVNTATGFRYQQLTNGQGQFAFELLPPGEYTARVTSEGMSPQISQPLHVHIGGGNENWFLNKPARTSPILSLTASPPAAGN